MGVFQTYRTAAGEGGMRQFLEHFGPCLSLPLTKLMDVPEFNNELIDLISNQSDTQANGLSVTELEQIRDKNLVEIQKALEKNNLTENTIVVFTSDNGPWLSYGDHAGSSGIYREGKGTAWEGGLRVPLIIAGPGIENGKESKVPVSGSDILPTIKDLAGK